MKKMSLCRIREDKERAMTDCYPRGSLRFEDSRDDYESGSSKDHELDQLIAGYEDRKKYRSYV